MSKIELDKSNWRVRFLSFIGLFILGIFVTSSIFEGKQNGWGIWIYDFQSLITGVLAIGAAFFTVDQMRRSDMQQEKRHREILEMNLRRDWMQIRRAFHPQVAELNAATNELGELLPILNSSPDEPGYKDVFKQSQKYRNTAHLIKNILEREQILDVKDFFDERAFRAFQISYDDIHFMIAFIENWHELNGNKTYENGTFWQKEEYWDIRIDQFMITVDRIRQNIGLITRQLTEMKNRLH